MIENCVSKKQLEPSINYWIANQKAPFDNKYLHVSPPLKKKQKVSLIDDDKPLLKPKMVVTTFQVI